MHAEKTTTEKSLQVTGEGKRHSMYVPGKPGHCHRITLQPTQASIADGIKTLNTSEILEGEHKKSLE